MFLAEGAFYFVGGLFEFVRKQGEAEGHGGRAEEGVAKSGEEEEVDEDRVEFEEEGGVAKKTQSRYGQKQQRLQEGQAAWGCVFFLRTAPQSRKQPKAANTRQKTRKGISKRKRAQKTRAG